MGRMRNKDGKDLKVALCNNKQDGRISNMFDYNIAKLYSMPSIPGDNKYLDSLVATIINRSYSSRMLLH